MNPHPALGDVTIGLHTDPNGQYAVVTHADPVVAITNELLHQISNTPTVTGGITRDGNTLTMGTPGKGLGRIAYQLTGQHTPEGHHIATRATNLMVESGNR